MSKGSHVTTQAMKQVTTTYAKARPSATVVLVRDGRNGPELLLVLRHAKSSFGASHVFPGGVLEATDELLHDHCARLDDDAANATLNMTAGGAAYYSGAIRELFEEAGVLLARTQQGHWADAGRFAKTREDLNAGHLLWSDFVRENDLCLAYDALHYFSFWVTPRELAKRFSTRFFIAALPSGQVATHCGGELTDSRWTGAAEAIAASVAGQIVLPQPTAATLKELTDFTSVESMLDWAAQQSKLGVGSHRPAIVSINGREHVVMPDSPDYPIYPDSR